MRICWDNLENVYLSKSGNFRKGNVAYVEMEACKICGDPYLTFKYKQSKFCGRSCVNKVRFYSARTREKISAAHIGKTISVEHKKKLAKSASKRIGCLNPHYKGGVKALGLTTYETHKDVLGLYEEIRKQKGTEVLEVRCVYCGQWFTPTRSSVNRRLVAINGLGKGEHRFYCSENCKQSCPTFGQHKYPKGFKKATSREVSTYLRQIIFERDNWECQKCGKTIKEVALHCHHIKGYAQNKILANDANNCITLCKDCHKEVHKQKGCRYIDLRCK